MAVAEGTKPNPADEGFKKYYRPQSDDYLYDYRNVIRTLFENTDERIGWYEPWQAWIVTSHKLCKQIFVDDRLTPDFMKWKFAPPAPPEAEKNDFERMLDHGLFRLHKEDHQRLRRLTANAFSVRVTNRIIDTIQDIVREAFDVVSEMEVFDVSTTLSVDIPRRSVARLVGIAPENDDVFNKLGWAMVRYNGSTTSPEDRDELLKIALEGIKMLRALIDERRSLADPGDDFMGELIKAQEGDDRLNDWEVLGIIAALLAAGSDTASDMHPSLLFALLSNPAQFALLTSKPELVDNAILECLRYESFGKTGLHRFALEDVEVGGKSIKRGEQLIIASQAAGLDPSQWKNPQTLDIERPLNGNIIFGAGPHVCAGINLAKSQAKLMLLEFIKRFPKAEIVEQPERDPQHYNARHFTKLLIRTNVT